MHIHCATILPLFSLGLSRQPRGPATPTEYYTLLDVYSLDPFMGMQRSSDSSGGWSERNGQNNLMWAEKQWKCDHNRKVCSEQTFTPCDYIFLEHPRTIASGTERSAAGNDSKLQPLRLGPYRIIIVGSKLIRILQDDTENKVSVNQVV